MKDVNALISAQRALVRKLDIAIAKCQSTLERPMTVARIVSQMEERASTFNLAGYEFARAYDLLRRGTPEGDLLIQLTILPKG